MKKKPSTYYQIQYWNKMWKDWLMFDQLFYKRIEDAEARIKEYKESVSNIKTRIIQTTVINKKVDKKQKGVKITTEYVSS